MRLLSVLSAEGDTRPLSLSGLICDNLYNPARSVFLGDHYNRTTTRAFTRDDDSFVQHLLAFFLHGRHFIRSNVVGSNFKRRVVVSI